MKYDAIKRKTGRRKCGQVDHLSGKKSIEVIGEQCGDSPKQVQRYLKITELIPELLEKVDDGSMGFTPAVQLSYLKKEEQQEILEAMDLGSNSNKHFRGPLWRENGRCGHTCLACHLSATCLCSPRKLYEKLSH